MRVRIPPRAPLWIVRGHVHRRGAGWGWVVDIGRDPAKTVGNIHAVLWCAPSDISDRIPVDANYAGQHRRRLIAAQMIEPPGRGIVEFTMPFLREYPSEQFDTGS